MIRWYELLIDLAAAILIAVGAGLIYLPAGFIAGGIILIVLSIGLRTRTGQRANYVAREVE